MIGNIESRHHQTSRNEGKIRVPLKNEKASRNEALQQQSHHKHLGCPPCKIHVTIPKMDKGGTQTGGSKDKRIDDYAQGHTYNRLYRQAVYIKKRRKKGMVSINNFVDASIKIRRLITAMVT